MKYEDLRSPTHDVHVHVLESVLQYYTHIHVRTCKYPMLYICKHIYSYYMRLLVCSLMVVTCRHTCITYMYMDDMHMYMYITAMYMYMTDRYEF